ncbi:hypothetical protein [Niastella sp. OAS944]|uniref:hypothetical protein n=1 Tax=Niastella sp. OAS944 TaxID=2664089 RepID=UPI0034713405|nr:hypothetical protein [Chitinophagaceae bacterium OAS944]
MKTIHFFVFILSVQAGFAQTIKSDKLYQFYKHFSEVEDSIAKTINLQNTIIYKICEGYSSFYFIQENLLWKGYFIKSLQPIEGIPFPSTIDTLENGAIVEFKPYNSELLVFNADSIVKRLLQNNITNIIQISEDALQAKLIKKGKKKNEHIIQSLPYASHDCNGTIIIYGPKNISATYRGALIEAENLHIIPTLRIFYETKQILLNATQNYQ